MSIFLTDSERKAFEKIGSDPIFSGHYWALFTRVTDKVNNLELSDKDTTTAFWHNVLEYLGDLSFLAAQRNDDKLKNFAKRTALSIAELPEELWIGPIFRERTYPLRGHLETAHLSAALSLFLDLCGDILTEEEYDLCVSALKEKAIPLCRAWLDNKPHFLNNWNAVLTMGVALPAAVLGLKDELEFCADYLARVSELLQSDGSYGEGLQYGNYYLWTFLLANEAVVRAGYPSAPLERAGKYLEYCHYNLLANKPLDGWGEYPRPRCFNFDDCTAIFAPNPDILALLGFRLKDSMPDNAVLARAILERFYADNPSQGPFDRTSFGFVPRGGWMLLLFYMQMKKDGVLPQFERTRAFKNGVAVIRTGEWSDNDLAVAVNAPAPEGLASAGHRHQDMNAIQIFFGRERLIADPGHACYRSKTRNADVGTASHSTCIFNAGAMMTPMGGETHLAQKSTPVRKTLADGTFGEPVQVPGKLEFTGSCGDVAAIVSEVAACYGEPLKLFRRHVIVCGKNAVFVIDDFDSDIPLPAKWVWCFNNRDGKLEYKKVNDASSQRMVIRRGNAGLKIMSGDRENLKFSGESYGFLHDAYHPDAGAEGAGEAGTALLAGHCEIGSQKGFRRHVFGMAADLYGASAHWHLKKDEDLLCRLESFGAEQSWQIDARDTGKIIITDRVSGKVCTLACENGIWQLS